MNIFSPKHPLWSLGFRPFFIFAILSAVLTTMIWVFQYTGIVTFEFAPLSPNQWHANEMIFGFLTAAIFGFLLTASANWTGTRGIHGKLLIAFCVLFLFTRFVFWTRPFHDIWIYQIIGAALPFCLVLHLSRLFIRTKNIRNLIILVPLGALIFSQVQILNHDYILGYELALYAVRFLVIVIAGRVIPFFTKSALKLEPKWNLPILEKLTLLSAFLLIFEPLYREKLGLGQSSWALLTILALLLNSYRILNWRNLASYKVKILFILYIAYFWLPIHFALNLASHWNLLNGKLHDLGKSSLHALAFGCFGIMIIGIIQRVSLGHTGRPIQASKLSIAAYWSIALGSLMRVFGPLISPENYFFWLKASGTLWVLAFTILGIVTIPKLISPRLDGREY